MKKAIIVFLLISILAGGVFAQVTFSGEGFGGIRLESHDGDETIDAFHRDEWSGVPRFDFTVTAMREDFGGRLDTTFQMTDDPDSHFILNGVYFWGNFLDNTLRLTVGQISTAAWTTTLHSSLDNYHFDDVRGLRLEYWTPVPGLRVGVAFETDGHDFESLARQMIFGGTFVHPLFSAVFAYDLGSNTRTLFGFNFTGIPDLTAGIQLRGTRLTSWSDEYFFGTLEMHQMVGYRITRPLFVYLITGQIFDGRSGAGPHWEITPGVEYRFLPNLTGSFSITLDNFDGNPNKNLTLNPVLEKMFRGPALFYIEYELRLDNMENPRHMFGLGIEIRAF